MTNNEKQAILGYLDMRLNEMCAKANKRFTKPNIDFLYHEAYGILVDIEETLEMHTAMSVKKY